MVIPIYSDKDSSYRQLNTGLNNKPIIPSIIKTTPISTIKETDNNGHKDSHSIQISEEAKMLNDYIKSAPVEEVNWEKVNKIKTQLASETYSINYENIAKKIIDFEIKGV